MLLGRIEPQLVQMDVMTCVDIGVFSNQVLFQHGGLQQSSRVHRSGVAQTLGFANFRHVDPPKARGELNMFNILA